MNIVSIIGRIATDIEIRYTQSGIAYTGFNIAVDRKFKDADGKRETDFFQCTAWRKTAELIGEYFKKGSRIGITGCLQVEKWETREGDKRQTVKIVIENIDFLDSKKEGGQGHENNAPPQSHEEGDDELPF